MRRLETGLRDAGSARVEVESILPGQPAGVRRLRPAAAVPRRGRVEAKGVYLQLGAFSVAGGADTFARASTAISPG
jgi:hypothetical protein